MSEETKLKAHDFLAGGRYVQIATVTQDNKPSLRNIAYVLEGNKIYFLTDKTTSKFKEIKNNPNVACLISKDEDDWSKTLQLKVTGKANLEINQIIAKIPATSICFTNFSPKFGESLSNFTIVNL